MCLGCLREPVKNYAAPKSVKKCSRLSRNFSDHPENIQPIQKLSRLSGNFLGYPETFRIILKISSLSGNFPGYPETFQAIRKISRLSGNFPNGPETSQCNFKGYAQKRSGCAKTFRMAMPPCHPGFWASVALKLIKTPFMFL